MSGIGKVCPDCFYAVRKVARYSDGRWLLSEECHCKKINSVIQTRIPVDLGISDEKFLRENGFEIDKPKENKHERKSE